MIMTTDCIFCGAKAVSDFFVKTVDGREYPIVRCSGCMGAFVWPRPSRAEMDEYYCGVSYSHIASGASVEYFPTEQDDACRIIAACKSLSKGRRFFDLGAGYGPFSYQALADGFDVSACEPNLNSREEFFKLNNFYPDSNVVDGVYANVKRGQFDVVLLSQVLEHICDPDNMIQHIHTMLCDGGLAAVAVPHFGSLVSKIQGERDMFISPPEHLNFFSVNGLIAAFSRRNFVLERIETVSKIPRSKIERKVAVPVLNQFAWALPYGILKLSELAGRGMVINAYFRKCA